ncbi:rhodanese-like domain-containing protein [Roseovarius sp.]|uniref:rhodanese-like domain-containing protein n=1 Tax=Roseovarius sp. TaxID=1486281 RepID=UPI003B5C4D18
MTQRPTHPRTTAEETRKLSESGREYALLDVRDEGAFSQKRLMLASCLPLSRLELNCGALVPRKSTPIVLMDGDGEGLADIAADRLAARGYGDLRVLEGGVAAWEAAGFPVYSGVNVMTKAFGEIVHTRCKTPDISAEKLHAWRAEGRNMVILDSRPYSEYHAHTIPGSISVPGAELAARVAALAPDPDTTIVVNCAGRTRSIIGCQSLINAGVPNQVYSLRNGTMGWKLAGFQVETGATRRADPPAPDMTLARAGELARQFDVQTLDPERLTQMRAARDRNIYLFDVRTPEDYAAGHVPGALNAPGGQLVQAMDEYVGVRNAVVVLTDPLMLRAVMTASWLAKIAQCEVYVLDPAPDATETAAPDIAGLDLPDVPTLSARDLAAELAGPQAPHVLDLSTSVQYRAGHIPGALWMVRGREATLRAELGDAAGTAPVVLCGPDKALLQLAAPEIATSLGTDVRLLDGGVDAWQAEGQPLETGMQRPVGPIDDVWYKPYELADAGAEKQAALDYLDWEIDLTEKVARDTVAFRPLHPAG